MAQGPLRLGGVLEEARAGLEALERLEQETVAYLLHGSHGPSDPPVGAGLGARGTPAASTTAAASGTAGASKPLTHRERLLQQHVVTLQLATYQEALGKRILPLLEPEYEPRRAYLEHISTDTHEFTTFYEQLKTIKDHHKHHPNRAADPSAASGPGGQARLAEEEQRERELLDARFSGQECLGRCVDLQPVFTLYQNLPGIEAAAAAAAQPANGSGDSAAPTIGKDGSGPALTYIQYLDLFQPPFTQLLALPRASKLTAPYANYLREVVEYLKGFLRRAQPFFDLPAAQANIRSTFAASWSEGRVPGWEGLGAQGDEPAIFCAPCQKYFAKRTVYEAHKEGKKHLKAAARSATAGQARPATTHIAGAGPDSADSADPVTTVAANANADASGPWQREREVALLEALMTGFATILSDTLAATKTYVERRQTLTEEERLAELEEEVVELGEGGEGGDAGSDSEGEDHIYNPLNLPLGFDGKPIPYWLYRLHGLGIKFPCEICGNFVYMGRKAFESHFQEARHSHGMRCLGIPNSKAFQDITSIADARALWAKMKTERQRASAVEEAIEFEDAEGNVFNKKTYEDLKRQGLL